MPYLAPKEPHWRIQRGFKGETKLFHFHGIFRKELDKISKANPHTFMYMNLLEIMDPPLDFLILMEYILIRIRED